MAVYLVTEVVVSVLLSTFLFFHRPKIQYIEKNYVSLFRGEKMADITKDYTVEGVPTAEVAVYFAGQCGLDLPIFRTVNDMIQGNISRDDLQKILMNRPLKSE